MDVLKGRDVDFGVMLLPDGSDTEPIRLFGPCRRATSLSANVLVPQPGTVVLGFDNSGMWFSTKLVRFRVRLDGANGGQQVAGVTDL